MCTSSRRRPGSKFAARDWAPAYAGATGLDLVVSRGSQSSNGVLAGASRSGCCRSLLLGCRWLATSLLRGSFHLRGPFCAAHPTDRCKQFARAFSQTIRVETGVGHHVTARDDADPHHSVVAETGV